MMMFWPVNCCMNCKNIPRKTTRRTFLFALNKEKPACLTFKLSVISWSSSWAFSLLPRRTLSTFWASVVKPLEASQRGLSGNLATAIINKNAGILMIPSISLQLSVGARSVSEMNAITIPKLIMSWYMEIKRPRCSFSLISER